MAQVILTGASSGLGRETARQLAQKGYQLVLVGRNVDSLRQIQGEYPKLIHILPADLSDPSQTAAIVENAVALFPAPQRLTHVINCAGFAVSGRTEDISEPLFEKCWRVNFTAAVSISNQAITRFRKSGDGMIVNIGSGVGRRALPYLSPYCTAKAALHSYTDSIRVELRGTGIRTLLFSPGPVESGFHDATIHAGGTSVCFPPFRGLAPTAVAKHLIDAIEKNKTLVVLGWKARLIHHLNFWAPGVVDTLLYKKFRVTAAHAR